MIYDPVSAWLEHLDLGIYREKFQQNSITWDVLPELNAGDLEGWVSYWDIEKNSCARSLNCHSVLKY